MEEVILVNDKDEIIGKAEKMLAHQQGLLHRAFSIFVFNGQNQLLLQKRSENKYHSSGLWTNTCCSHPRLDEPINVALNRKLMQEMGFVCPLKKAFNFQYKASLENGLTEHELDYVYIGNWEGIPTPNPQEVSAWRWAGIEEIKNEINTHPEIFTYWFKEIILNCNLQV